MATSQTSRRRRGAPRGNKNALKHGFYARQFRPADVKDLDAHDFQGLSDEITLQRVVIRRLYEQTFAAESIAETLPLFRLLTFATLALTRLVRAQHILHPPGADTQAAIQQAIADVLAELQSNESEALADPNLDPIDGFSL